jgi:pimeloyl-ACP methyl ester carboxylesterase
VRGVLVAALAALAVGTSAAPALARDDGPELDVPAAALARSLACHGDLSDGERPTPVLLIPGTTLTPDVNFDWNYEPALSARGVPWCAVTLPHDAMSDIQVSAEYVVAALRAMHRRSGGRVDVVGFSQGGMIGRWALKFWPDTRGIVEDLVGIDPSNHGTLDAYPVCTPACAPAFWQQQTGSRFLAALNAGGETYPGIDYTQVYTATDEVVVPNLPPAPSSALHAGAENVGAENVGAENVANVLVQDICPVHVAEHLSMGSIDPVGWAVVLDALTHDGPARAGRIGPSVCARALMPGVNPATVALDEARYNAQVATVVATAARVPAEPPLKPYVTDRR